MDDRIKQLESELETARQEIARLQAIIDGLNLHNQRLADRLNAK